VKPFKASSIGTMKMSKINGPRRLASAASNFYKIIKIINRYIKVLGFALATLVCLHSSFSLFIFKIQPPAFKQCNLAKKSHKGKYAPT
jgi:hypothetical protein